MLAKKYGLKACFIAGTLVATAGGAQAIETLTPGDVVLAVDEHTNVVSERALLGVSSREVERYLDVRLESPGQAEGAAAEAEHLGVTAEHPFWTSVGWKAAAELVPGDVVLSPHSGWLRVGGSTWVQGPARVWNLEVEEDHTFAVGELAAWVHNGCGSLNQFQKQVERGKTPKSVDRVDKGLGPHEQDHVHFKDGSALNRDGTWKHGGRELTKAESELLQQFGWTIP